MRTKPWRAWGFRSRIRRTDFSLEHLRHCTCKHALWYLRESWPVHQADDFVCQRYRSTITVRYHECRSDTGVYSRATRHNKHNVQISTGYKARCTIQVSRGHCIWLMLQPWIHGSASTGNRYAVGNTASSWTGFYPKPPDYIYYYCTMILVMPNILSHSKSNTTKLSSVFFLEYAVRLDKTSNRLHNKTLYS